MKMERRSNGGISTIDKKKKRKKIQKNSEKYSKRLLLILLVWRFEEPFELRMFFH